MSALSAANLSDDWAAGLHMLGLDALAGKTADLLTAAGIPNLLLKGPATAHRLYPEHPGVRRYGDVDLLVPVQHFVQAQNVMRANDYRAMAAGTSAADWAWHEIPWLGPPPVSLVIDLHRGFAGVTDPEAFFRVLWATRSSLQVCGSTVAVPSAAGTALIIALHAASPGRSGKPLTDLMQARAVLDTPTWRDAAALARECGAESALRAGLGLLPGGGEFADDLGIRGTVAAEHWLGGRQRDRVSVSLAEAIARPGLRGTAAYVVRRVLPSAAFLRLSDPAANNGRWGLAAAYGRRMGRVVVKAPRAALDVLEARRSTDSGRRTTRLTRKLRYGNRVLRHLLRVLRRADLDTVRVARWSLLAHRSGREQLRADDGLRTLQLSAPPFLRAGDRAAVQLVLRARNATCLEKAVVLQRFDAAAGRPRTLVVGVTSPRTGFRAHAWLDGDPQTDPDLQEILRHEAPAAWCSPLKMEAT